MNRLKVVKIQLLVAILASLFVATAVAEDAKQKGLKIAEEMEFRDRGWGDSQSELQMKLTNRHGKSSSRKMSIKNLEVSGDGDKSLTVFHEPRDVKGTAFLSFSHTLVPDDQWLFLPALKRVKRIASANKSGPFLGSEFAFEDISSFEVSKYDYELLREDTLNETPVFVVKFVPKYEYSGYQFVEWWIDRNEYIPHKVVFYDRKGKLLKTLEYLGYQKYMDKYWRADEFLVSNVQTGKKTSLKWNNYKFKAGLKDSDFTKNVLKRAR